MLAGAYLEVGPLELTAVQEQAALRALQEAESARVALERLAVSEIAVPVAQWGWHRSGHPGML